MKYKLQNGQALVEILLVIALTAIMFPALITGLISSREGKSQQEQRTQAIALMKEAEEAARSVREKGWAIFAVNGTFHPQVSGNTWTFASGSAAVNGMTRSITLSDVYRDANGSIATTGGSLDPTSKKVYVAVSWGQPIPSSVNSTFYLTRYLDNDGRIETTVADFTPGTTSGTNIVNDSGGEIVLGAGGAGDWCQPTLAISAINLPKSGVANAISASEISSTESAVFTGTGDNSSGVSYATVNIANTDPPTGVIEATFDGYKTNDGIFGNANYAYLATDTNSKEVVIVNLSSITAGKYAEAGYFNAPGNGSGLSVHSVVNGAHTIGFMTSGSNLYTFDLDSNSGSRTQLGSASLAGTGKKVIGWRDVATGTLYAFVATSSTSNQLQIFQLNSTGTTITLVGQADLTGNAVSGLFINDSGTRAYVATAVSAIQNEMYIVDISTKTGARNTIGSYDSSGMDPKGITVVPGNRAILVGTGGKEYQVINISTESSPTPCGNGLEIDSGINGVASVVEADGDAYSYIITGDSDSELKIIEGGPGGQYSSSGTFTSSYFDATTSAVFINFVPNFSQPSQTTVRFQVAVADAVNNSCVNALYSFVGPNGYGNDYYTTAGTIPTITSGNYTNPGRCFKYKAYLDTTDATFSPTVNDMTINYLP